MLTSLQALLRLAVLQRLGVFICALATLLAATSTASALEPAQTKTRVWGFDFAADNSVGLFRAVSPRTHLENRAAGAEAALGSLLAAEGAAAAERGIVAADLGLSGKGITNLTGTVVNAGSTRIISVANITATRGALVGELRGALPNILNAARAEGVQTLQISASFANPGLAEFAATQAAQYGGTFSSAAGQETLTFILGVP